MRIQPSFSLLTVLLLTGCSSMAAAPRPATTAVSAYEACVLKGTATQPKSATGRIAAAEAGCAAELDAYRQQYRALGISAEATETAVARIVDQVRSKAASV